MKNITTSKRTGCGGNKLLYLIAFNFLILSCHKPEEQHLNNYTFKLVSKVRVDESALTLCSMPEALTDIDDSTIACIVDQRIIAVYNTTTGALLDHYDCDTLMHLSGFRPELFVRNKLKGRYHGRTYIDDTAELNQEPGPKYTIDHIAGSSGHDHLFLSTGISVYYRTLMFLSGKVQTVKVQDNAIVLFDLDLRRHNIRYLHYIDQHQLDTSNNRDACLSIRSGTYYSDSIFYGHISPDRSRIRPVPHFVIFDCRTDSLSFSEVRSPYIERNPRYHNYTSFVPDDSLVLFNTYREIYGIDKRLREQLVVALKDSFDVDYSEHMVAIGRLGPDLLLAETLLSAPFKSTDSERQYYQAYYLFEPSTTTFSRRLARHEAKGHSFATAFTNSEFIKFSKDEEHYYIETYRLHRP